MFVHINFYIQRTKYNQRLLIYLYKNKNKYMLPKFIIQKKKTIQPVCITEVMMTFKKKIPKIGNI